MDSRGDGTLGMTDAFTNPRDAGDDKTATAVGRSLRRETKR